MSYQPVPIVHDRSYPGRPTSATYGQAASQARGQPISPAQAMHFTQGATASLGGDTSVTSLSNSFGQTHIGVPTTSMSGSTSTLPVPASQYFYTADGQLVYAPGASIYSTQAIATPQLSDGSFGGFPGAMQYLAPTAYSAYIPGYPMLPYTPGRSSFYSDRSEIAQKGVPGLDNRRGSYSTDESAPGTPYYGGLTLRDNGAHIAIIDRSPVYSTPSPQIPTHHLGQNIAKSLPYKSTLTNMDLDALVQQHPDIPRAVPAVFTPPQSIRTLEQSLNNQMPGNRNVYIRGLHPDTDDGTLAAYAARFGKVETSKAIIDTSTGACKGFGFAKYYDIRDSELCIRGFHRLGYEVGFARESFNSRLKAEGDETSTNLYVSNLPRNMTEAELSAIFMDYTVVSSRILRDSQGQSRGVGFARFETREVCEEIIKKFHGQPIGGEGLLLQVRYADTAAQKELKKITTERRQFRTQEYNVGAYGDPTVIAVQPGMQSPVLPRMAQIARHLPQSKVAGPWKRETSVATLNDSIAGLGIQLTNKSPVKILQPRISPMKSSKMSQLKLTPTVSEDGSEDEGATVHGISPLLNRGGVSIISPSAKKP